MTNCDTGEPTFGGVSLSQHAGVAAALGDGLALAEVLRQEEIEEASWPTADRLWMQALADSTDLQLQYLQRRREAEDALARKIEPLDEDAAAWAGLLGALALSPAPQGVLDPLGLRMSDIGRLGRHWNRKAEADPKVVDALTAAAGKAPAPTQVKAEPMVLKRFSWSPGAPGPATTGGSSVALQPDGFSIRLAALSAVHEGKLAIELDADLFAAMLAVEQVLPAELPRALALCVVDEERFETIAEDWEERMQSRPDLRAWINLHLTDHRDALRRLLAGARPQLCEVG